MKYKIDWFKKGLSPPMKGARCKQPYGKCIQLHGEGVGVQNSPLSSWFTNTQESRGKSGEIMFSLMKRKQEIYRNYFGIGKARNGQDQRHWLVEIDLRIISKCQHVDSMHEVMTNKVTCIIPDSSCGLPTLAVIAYVQGDILVCVI